MSNKHIVLIILAAGLITHFLFFGHPNQAVFDEVHFGKFVTGYYTHEYFFDIHPPLGKLAIAGFAKLFNFKPEYSFAQIGEQFPDKQYMVLRFLPCLAGAILPLIIFLLALELGFSRFAAAAAGLFITLENAILTQSIYILLDAFLLLFGFTALLFYFKYSKSKRKKHLVLFAAFAALAASIKWTGLAFLFLPALLELYNFIKDKNRNPRIILRWLIFFGVIPFAIYFSVFAIHFGLLYKSGPGDAFMSVGFQKTLEGNAYANTPDIKTPNIFSKFVELNLEMYTSNQRLTATHPYGSPWYTWPFMARPIYYWVSGNSRIYLIGNPIIWWLSTVAVIAALASLAGRRKIEQPTTFLLAGWVLNLLPFIGIKRVMFLYHYLTALIFAILILVYLIDQNRYRNKILATFLVAALITFVFFAPLNYGLPLDNSSYHLRLWLNSWE